MKKKSFASLTNNFWSFKKRIKKIFINGAKLVCFFHQKSEGIAFTFCRYLYQNLRVFIFCRYCPPIVFCPQIWKTKKSSKIEGNTLGILRRSFFPFNALGMPSFSNSVCIIAIYFDRGFVPFLYEFLILSKPQPPKMFKEAAMTSSKVRTFSKCKIHTKVCTKIAWNRDRKSVAYLLVLATCRLHVSSYTFRGN